MNALIVGGSSGLGLEIGRVLSESRARIYVTGRAVKELPKGLAFIELNITENLDRLRQDLDGLASELPSIDLIIYAAGFLEKGHTGELSDNHIAAMIHVGLTTPAFILQRIIKKQKSLGGFIAVTSTSGWIPRELEPVYSAVKSGLAMLANSASLDPKIKKTLVVGPAGMNTNFWKNSGRDTNGLLSPRWVAKQILKLWDDNYVYRIARILRDPTPERERVQIIETRIE